MSGIANAPSSAIGFGAGGNGGGITVTGGNSGQGGGGAGAYVDALIPNPSSSYFYSVGIKGNNGGAGVRTAAGSDGAPGVIVIEEQYS